MDRVGEWLLCYHFDAESFHAEKLSSRLYSTEIEFYSPELQIRLLSHPLENLEVTYALHLWLFGKYVVDFLFAVI